MFYDCAHNSVTELDGSKVYDEQYSFYRKELQTSVPLNFLLYFKIFVFFNVVSYKPKYFTSLSFKF